LNWAAFGGTVGGTAAGDERTQIKTVKRIISHPLVAKTRGFAHNDVALIELTDNFEFNQFVQPICLGQEEPTQGDMCITAGWSDAGQSKGNTFSRSILVLRLLIIIF
jgi:hypothetical protein